MTPGKGTTEPGAGAAAAGIDSGSARAAALENIATQQEEVYANIAKVSHINHCFDRRW